MGRKCRNSEMQSVKRGCRAKFLNNCFRFIRTYKYYWRAWVNCAGLPISLNSPLFNFHYLLSRSLGVFLSGLDWGVLDVGDLILNHWAEGIRVELVGALLLLLISGHFLVLDWLTGLGVLSSVGNNWWISLDGGVIHRDLIVFLLFELLSRHGLGGSSLLLVSLFWLFLINLLGFLFGFILLSFLSSFLLGRGLNNCRLGRGLLAIWFLFWCRCSAGGLRLFFLSSIGIFLHILSQLLHEVVRELGSELNCLGRGLWAEEGDDDKSCSSVFHLQLL